MKIESIFLIFCIIVFTVTVISLRFLIPFLASKKMGQKILEIGPRWHKSKEGTPTMGGLSFIFATIIAFVVFILAFNKSISREGLLTVLNIIVYSLLNAMIGIIDDFAKLKKSKNEGLTPKTKFIFQSLAAIFFLISLRYSVGISTDIYIPFLNKSIEVGFFYYIVAYLALCGIVNSVNLTDGIDGLASSVTLSVGVLFAVISLSVVKDPIIAFFSAVLIGATLGFLVYNFYPAKIFMGDTGSLFLGALVVSISFLIDNILLVLVYGFVFVIETLSDILQVMFFKLTNGKRLFKMAPLHHHLEKCGLKEVQIVIIFTAINALFCIFAYFGLGNL